MQPELELPEDSVVRPKGLWSRGQSVSTDEASGAEASSDGSAAEAEAQDASVCACLRIWCTGALVAGSWK